MFQTVIVMKSSLLASKSWNIWKAYLSIFFIVISAFLALVLNGICMYCMSTWPNIYYKWCYSFSFWTCWINFKNIKSTFGPSIPLWNNLLESRIRLPHYIIELFFEDLNKFLHPLHITIEFYFFQLTYQDLGPNFPFNFLIQFSLFHILFCSAICFSRQFIGS